jgi:LuxR family maltose regulon positive regulatory protein
MTEDTAPIPAVSPLLSTRLLIPRPRGQEVVRPALIARLAQIRTVRTALITAPAGYGKTMLAAAAVRQLSSMSCAWLTLDSADDQPLRFLLALSAALSRFVPAAASLHERFGHSRVNDGADALLDLAAAAEPPLLLVLDDLHLITDPAVYTLLDRMIRQSPQQLHWLLVSRHEPPLRTARGLLEADLIRLKREDLRLSEAETADYLAMQALPAADSLQLHDLHQRSDGWFAGLQCAFLAMQQTTQPQTIDRMLLLLRGDQRLMSDYMMQEILVMLPARLVEFLLLCALPDRLSPALCDALTGTGDSAALLGEVEQRQLFLQPLDDFGEWYVLHTLWRSFLTVAAQQRLSEEMRRAAACRAAEWFLVRDELPAALQMLVRSRQDAAAVALFEQRAWPLVYAHRLTELEQCMQLLSGAVVRSATALTVRAWLEFFSERLSDLDRTLTELERFAAPEPAAVLIDRLILRQLLLMQHGDRRRIFSGLWALRERMAHAGGYAAGWGWLLLAICYQADLAPESDLFGFFQQARQAFHQVDAGFGGTSVRVMEVMPLRDAGRLRELVADCGESIGYIRRHLSIVGAREAQSQLLLFAGEAHFWLDQLPEAVTLLQEAYHETRTAANHNAAQKAALWLEICRAAGAQLSLPAPLPESVDWLDQADRSAEPIGNRSLLLYLTALRTIISGSSAADCRRAVRVLNMPLHELDREQPKNVVLAVAAARIALRDLDDDLFVRLTAAAKQMDAQRSRHMHLQLLVFAAIVAHLLGRRAQARVLLRRVVGSLEQSPYLRLPLLAQELVPLLRSIDHPTALQLLSRLEEPPPERRLSEQEIRILRLLAEGHSQAEIAARLIITVATVKWHLYRAYRSIGVKNRREAVQWVQQHL